MMRATAAALLLVLGLAVEEVQALLGHASPVTTQRYVAAGPARGASAGRPAHPAARASYRAGRRPGHLRLAYRRSRLVHENATLPLVERACASPRSCCAGGLSHLAVAAVVPGDRGDRRGRLAAGEAAPVPDLGPVGPGVSR
ncbi:hypothetical protein [Nonomuraea monospora]|uniref:hypothetical protein n=1 Tax=Nonomuraea monospora TaxID=568818 RepID=UPI003CD0B925